MALPPVLQPLSDAWLDTLKEIEDSNERVEVSKDPRLYEPQTHETYANKVRNFIITASESAHLLRSGMLISDEPIIEYTKMMNEELVEVADEDEALLISPAFMQLIKYALDRKEDLPPLSNCKGSRFTMTHDRLFKFTRIVYPGHDGVHFTLILILPQQWEVVVYDSLNEGDGWEHKATEVLRWITRIVGEEEGKKFKVKNSRSALQQAPGSKDGSIMTKLHLRFLSLGLEVPALPEGVSMEKVERNFRRRVAAELLANKLNPTDDDVNLVRRRLGLPIFVELLDHIPNPDGILEAMYA